MYTLRWFAGFHLALDCAFFNELVSLVELEFLWVQLSNVSPRPLGMTVSKFSSFKMIVCYKLRIVITNYKFIKLM